MKRCIAARSSDFAASTGVSGDASNSGAVGSPFANGTTKINSCLSGKKRMGSFFGAQTISPFAIFIDSARWQSMRSAVKRPHSAFDESVTRSMRPRRSRCVASSQSVSIPALYGARVRQTMLTVLIVDDNATFRSQAARLCAAERFATVTAGSLSELANVLATSSPDLALVDIEFPQIPGHRLGALIRSRKHIPIVLVSAL